MQKKKSLSLNEKYWRTFWKKLGEWTISKKKRTRQEEQQDWMEQQEKR